ncbi:MAG TPA: PAS domain-containing protein [Bradyrhizobium sp.]
MNNAEFQLQGVSDPRLAVHATSALPAWLWSIDGTRILWANPVGARLFDAANGAALAKKTFGPADSHRRQVARLASRLPSNAAIRLERLRGFGATFGTLATCGCARLDFADGGHGILVVGAAKAAGRTMPLVERLQRLVEGIDAPMAALTRDGLFVGASDAARSLLGFRNLSEVGLDGARSDALQHGRVETAVGIGRLILQRVGTGADVGLVALIAPGATLAAHVRHVAPASPETARAEAARQPVAPTRDLPMPDNEQSAMTGEAAAEVALIDEFAEQPAEAAVEHSSTDAPPEPDLPRAEVSATSMTPEIEVHQDEPSPYVEAVADEPAAARGEDLPSKDLPSKDLPPAVDPTSPAIAPEPASAPSWPDEPSPSPPEHLLRFLWRINAEGRFSLDPSEFTRLIGARTAARFERLMSDIAGLSGLDPDGRFVNAVATHDTWSGITLNWPVDGGDPLPVELSGLPITDSAANFAGYRGFGVCGDLDGLAQLAALRRDESFSGPSAPQMQMQMDPAVIVQPNSADIVATGFGDSPAAELPAKPDVASSDTPPSPNAFETSQQTDLETAVETPKETPKETPTETPKNVLPFRPISDPKSPALTSVENSAFNELARQLSARLDSENGGVAATPATPDAAETVDGPPSTPTPEPPSDQPAIEQPEWLAPPEAPARGEARRDKPLFDLLPVGVLIYRLDRLLYANRPFLEQMGYESLHALEEAGGLDALYVAPGVSSASSTSDTGRPVTISGTEASSEGAPAIDARLYTISWDGDSALALIFSGTRNEAAAAVAVLPEFIPFRAPSAVGHANAEELGVILDTTAEGIVMFDVEGNIHSCNRSAEALFGYDGTELVQRNLIQLFAPESQPAVLDYLKGIKGADVASLLDHGRDVLGRVRKGGIIPLSMTMGRTRPDGPNFFTVFRDVSQSRKSEGELPQAGRPADRAADAKAEMLARISHEVRTPLNAIIGFAEVMIGERFGKLGNARYIEYMKDIRSSGEHVIAIINDLLDLSRIETGRLDLTFASQNLNDLVEQCVAVMQPQANRERIIIRTSLAQMLPPVIADARALRQIALNLIGNSIHLANAGGQVIVSTALSDFDEVVLRVRDSGQGLNDNEVAAALEPFRTQAPSDQAPDGSGVNLSLTKALVEANRAHFHIKTASHSGTLIEVTFSHARAKA